MKKRYYSKRRRQRHDILRVSRRILFLLSVCLAVYKFPSAENSLRALFSKLSGYKTLNDIVLQTGLSLPYGSFTSPVTFFFPQASPDIENSGENAPPENTAPPDTGVSDAPSPPADMIANYDDDGNIVRTTITGKGSSRYKESDGIYINNKTAYSVSADLSRSPIRLENSGVQVLIVHTHGSEAYAPSGDDVYVPSDPSRTEDKQYNVVRLGDELEKILNDAGIGTVHDRELYDYPTYTGSYGRSLEAIKTYLKKYPSIKIVLDIHRDALEGDGITYKTVADIDGVGECSQIMLVVGTDYNGLEHNAWRDNLKFAVMLQKNMNEKFPTLARPLTISGSRYNQHLTKGSLIVEVGTNGNTLQESLKSIRLFSDSLIDVLSSLK